MKKSSILFVILACALSTPVYCSKTQPPETPSGPKSPTQPNVVSPLSSSITKPFSSLPHKKDLKSLVPRTLNILSPRLFLDQLVDQEQFQELLQSKEGLTLKKVLQYILRLFKEVTSEVTERLDEMDEKDFVEILHLGELTKDMGMFSNSLYNLLTGLASSTLQYRDLKANWSTWKKQILKNLNSQLERLTLNGPEVSLQRELKWGKGQSPLSRKVWDFFKDPKNYQTLWVWLSTTESSALAKTCKNLSVCFSHFRSKYPSYKIHAEWKFKRLIPYPVRHDWIDNNKDEKTIEGTMNGLIEKISLYIEYMIHHLDRSTNIVIKDDMRSGIWNPMYYNGVDVSLWMKKTLLYMLRKRENAISSRHNALQDMPDEEEEFKSTSNAMFQKTFNPITTDEYEDMLRRIPDELRRQVYGYFNHVKKRLISNSHYDYKEPKMNRKNMKKLQDKNKNAFLASEALIGHPSSPLFKLIYAAVYTNPDMRFAIFDLVELVRLNILSACYDTAQSASDIGLLDAQTLQRYKLQPLKVELPTELIKTYKMLFEGCSITKLTVYRRQVLTDQLGDTSEHRSFKGEHLGFISDPSLSLNQKLSYSQVHDLLTDWEEVYDSKLRELLDMELFDYY